LPEPRRVVIEYEDFVVEVVVRPRRAAAEPAEAKAGPAAREEAARSMPAREKVALVLDQMFRIGSVLEPLVPEGTVIYEVVGRGLREEVRISDRYVQVPARDDYDIYKLVERLSGQHERVVFISGDRKLVNALRFQVAQRGQRNVELHYMPPSEFPGRAQMIDEILKHVRLSSTREP